MNETRTVRYGVCYFHSLVKTDSLSTQFFTNKMHVFFVTIDLDSQFKNPLQVHRLDLKILSTTTSISPSLRGSIVNLLRVVKLTIVLVLSDVSEFFSTTKRGPRIDRSI